jgi:hypothetical protein
MATACTSGCYDCFPALEWAWLIGLVRTAWFSRVVLLRARAVQGTLVFGENVIATEARAESRWGDHFVFVLVLLLRV